MERNRLISVRKLAAIDIVFHGPRLVLLEYSVGMALSAVLGLWFIYRGLGPALFHSLILTILGFGLLGIGLNYFPLLVYAIQIVRQKRAKQMVVKELGNPALYQKVYGQQSMILILVPLALFLLAIVQEARGLRSRSG
jgi:hypothetical protein